MREDIARLLLKTKAVTLRPDRPYIWTSGIRSPVYCDNRLLLSYPKARDEIQEAFIKLIRTEKIKFDALAGIATGGVPHAAILADRLKVPMLYVRASPKAHGKANRIEGRLEKGSQILVIEDLVSTGQSSLEAVTALRGAGAKVNHCLSIFSYDFPFTRNAFQRKRCQLHSLTNLGALLDVAAADQNLSDEDVRLIAHFSKNPKDW